MPVNTVDLELNTFRLQDIFLHYWPTGIRLGL